VCDASFIGIAKVLEVSLRFAKPAARALTLVQPQFEAGEVQSLALLPLREGAIDSADQPAFGLIVLGSHDPHRFEATMGTEFLSRMAELASSALSRMR
jgi:uncharacterized protein YigA (DUF484 family)